MTTLAFIIQSESPGDAEVIERLHERAFGPGRFVRSSERVREMAEYDRHLSFVARVATLVVGSVRQTPIRIGDTPALLLGPLTVEPAFMGRGIGKALLERSIAEARNAGRHHIVLVGDETYYGRVGFKGVPAGRIKMPGPVDPGRVLLWNDDPETAKTVTGLVRPPV